ncbi:MAG: alpha/beta hydrolase [Cyclobacteriaceae bacterium]
MKLITPFLIVTSFLAVGQPIPQTWKEGYAINKNVKIHFVTAGEGPLVILLHGFPDYWYSWRNIIPELEENYTVVAIDLRGYNKSSAPEGVENYKMSRLMEDVISVMDHFDAETATIMGHDWGGAIAWNVTFWYPSRVEKLVVLNVPHPNGLNRELAKSASANEGKTYASKFLEPNAHETLTNEWLSGWVNEAEVRPFYIEAFKRSSKKAMLNYYKANFPNPGSESESASNREIPSIKCPVLLIHGLDDPYLSKEGLNGTWDWIDSPLTIVTIPNAGHFVQHDAPIEVAKSIKSWLTIYD